MKAISLMKNSAFLQKAARKAEGIIFFVKKNKPEILFGLGLVAGAGCVYTACKGTLEVKPVLDECAVEYEAVKEATKLGEFDGEPYTAKDRNADLVELGKNIAKSCGKAYWKSIIFGAVSIGCHAEGLKTLRQRLAASTTAFAALSLSFSKYREQVKEKYGEEVDEAMIFDLKTVSEPVEEVGADGKVHKKKKEKQVMDPSVCYSYIFDKASGNYTGDYTTDMYLLQCRQSYYNDILNARRTDKTPGYVTLLEVLKDLDILKTDATKEDLRMYSLCGWTTDGPDGYVKLNWKPVNDPDGKAVWLINPNVQGCIF